jgi:hypothetical protein
MHGSDEGVRFRSGIVLIPCAREYRSNNCLVPWEISAQICIALHVLILRKRKIRPGRDQASMSAEVGEYLVKIFVEDPCGRFHHQTVDQSFSVLASFKARPSPSLETTLQTVNDFDTVKRSHAAIRLFGSFRQLSLRVGSINTIMISS